MESKEPPDPIIDRALPDLSEDGEGNGRARAEYHESHQCHRRSSLSSASVIATK